LEETKTAILPELVELTNDEHSHVRLAGLDTVVSILTLLDNGLFCFPVLLINLAIVVINSNVLVVAVAAAAILIMSKKLDIQKVDC